MRLTTNHTRHARGFSLIELMVAMLAGLIVLGAAVVFTVTSMRSYSENILSAKLTQELRTSMNLVVRELRRAGHDSTSVTRVLTTSSASSFDNFVVDGDCITYEYDRQVGADGPDATEMRGFRLNDGVLQLNAASAAIDCDSDADWEDITDPEVVTITKFEPQIATSWFCSQVAERDTDGDTVMDEFDMAEGAVRTVSLCLAGQMASGDAISRHVADSVRIRAEELDFVTKDNNICEPGADPMIDIVDLNEGCAE